MSLLSLLTQQTNDVDNELQDIFADLVKHLYDNDGDSASKPKTDTSETNKVCFSVITLLALRLFYFHASQVYMPRTVQRCSVS
jgi:hypothetical protein